MTRDRLIAAAGAAFTLGVIAALVWLHAAEVYVPKPRYTTNRVMAVCGFDLERVHRWMNLAPMCRFELIPWSGCPISVQPGNYLTVGNPAYGAAETTSFQVRPDGETLGALVVLTEDASDLVGAHGLCHAAGWTHSETRWGRFSTHGHLMAKGTAEQGPSTEGMDLLPHEIR